MASISHLLTRRLTRGLSKRLDTTFPDGTFSPASVGALAWWDASDASSLYQERTVGGTTLSTLGGVAGTIRDKSGNGYHLAATSDAARGLYDTSGGYSFVATDGVDDEYSATGAAIIGVLNDKDWYVGAAVSSLAAAQERHIFSTTSSTNIHVPASQANVMSVRFGGTYYNAAGTAPTLAAANVLAYNCAAGTFVGRKNGVNGAGVAVVATATGTQAFVASRNASQFMTMRLHALVVVPRALTASELTAMDVWLAARNGTVL